MTSITLKCFDCAATKEVIVTAQPTFSFELVQIANDAGILGVFDFQHKRALVFCNEECCNNSKTKKGTYRIRPRKVG